MRYSLFVLLILLLTYNSCAPEQNDDRGKAGKTANDEVYLECQFTGEDVSMPYHDVYIRVGEYQMKVAETNACGLIEKAQYSDLQIPDQALAAVGGWWAGVGDYLYATLQEGKVHVYQAYIDEEMESEKIDYQLIATYQDGKFLFEAE